MPRAALVSGLLIIGLEDNISDSLSIHIYQGSENLELGSARKATLANFLARLVIAITFVGFVILSRPSLIVAPSVAWGVRLLRALTSRLARIRQVTVSPWPEMTKHLVITLIRWASAGAWAGGSNPTFGDSRNVAAAM